MFDRIKHRIQYRYYIIRQEKNLKARKYADSAKMMIDKTVAGVGEEARETEEMAQAFFRMLEHKLKLNTRTESPTEEEVREAIEQLKDVGRFSVFATVSILPGGGISLIGLELLAKKFGIRNFTFIPSSFRKHIFRQGDENSDIS